ncbi:MAG: glycosyltransferase [Candidatus Uhrbacteria bacterium]|nr:glycosyltransferase [Candidatus Uhrbacteria bacterium]
MNSSISLTIVIPNYNYAIFLEELLLKLSALRNRSMIEVILVDGLSTDNTCEVAHRYLLPHDIFITEKDSGQSDAINKGLAKASGRWFMFQNSDDFFDFTVLDEFLEISDTILNYDVIAFNQDISSLSDGVFIISPGFRHSSVISWRQLSRNIYYTNQSTIYNTNLSKRVGFDASLRFSLDYDFVVRFFKMHHPKVRIFNKVLGVQRMHGQSKTNNMQSVCLRETKLIRSNQFSNLDLIVGLALSLKYYFLKVIDKFVSLR